MSTNPFLVLLLIAVPLVVHVKGILPSNDLWQFDGYPIEADLFTYWKARTLIVLAFLSMWWPRQNSLPLPMLRWTFVFMLALLLSTILSDYPYLSMYGTPNYNEGALCWLAYLTIMLVAVDLPAQSLTRILGWSVFAVSAFCALQVIVPNPFMLPGIHQLIAPTPIDIVKTNQIYGTLMNPNHLGLYCAMLLPFFVAEMEWSPIIMLSVMLLVSQSRGAIVGASVALGYLTVMQNKRRIILITILCAVALMAVILSHHMDYGRLTIWRASLPLLKDTLLLGKGPATFINYLPQMQPGVYVNVLVDRAHNLYVHVWHGSGLPALVALLGIFWISFKEAKLPYRAAILGYAVASFFTDSFVGVTPLFFALLGNVWRKE